jgi:hypothetical protein
VETGGRWAARLEVAAPIAAGGTETPCQ